MITRQENQRISVIAITDTRMFGDDRKPISGTGDAIKCEHCGKDIEIHAEVELYDVKKKSTISYHIIGTECCKKLNAAWVNPSISVSNKDYWKRPNFLICLKPKTVSTGLIFK
jgi:hypothetical protein